MATYNITIFQTIKDTATPFHCDIYTILNRIKDGKSRDTVKRVRAEKDKTQRNEIKKLLPAICFSGTFTKREDKALLEHSGIICLDFDGYPTQKDMLQDKEMLTKNKYVFSVFISPSGNGLKVLVKIPKMPEHHISHFNSLEKFFNSPYFDKTSKNVSRVCFESYDPLLFVNVNSSIWDTIEETEYREVHKYGDAPTIPITDENKIIEILVKWWTKKFPMTEGKRNHNVYVLAMALNEYGVNIIFAKHLLYQYATADFTEKEITTTIDSAYKNTSTHGTKYYEDDERISQIKERLKRGTSKKEIRLQLQDTIDGDIIDSVLNRIDEDNNEIQFWHKNDKGAAIIIPYKFKQFLESNGFYKYCPEGGKNYVFVKVTNNLVDNTDHKEIKDFVLQYLEQLEDLSIFNYFANNTRLFKEDYLSLLSTIDIYFISDTADTAYLYYRNCAARITAKGVTAIDYFDLGGYVWKDHVIDRTFCICPVTDECSYQTFIKNVNGSDPDRIKTMESTIGFMMHGYKNLSFCPAVILNDEIISDNPEGGTGKGLWIRSLSQMKKVVIIDGKDFLPDKNFAYQLVSADTQILCFDDVKKYFDFQRLFSVITEGITLEKKNKDAIKLPYEKSPKIAITTNYAIKGSGNSFARRKWELELHQYYNKNFTPEDEFGKMMFSGWNDEEWCEFDNYMIGCLQFYLTNGLVKSKFVNLRIRQLSAETCHEFIEWCGLIDKKDEDDHHLPLDTRLRPNDLFAKFVEEYPDYAPRSKHQVSRNRFYKWLNTYSVFKVGSVPEEGRDQQGKYILIKSKDDDTRPTQVEDIVPF
jgi:VirE N-terminal domain